MKMENLQKEIFNLTGDEKTELYMKDVKNLFMKVFQNRKLDEDDGSSDVDVDIFEKVKKAKEFQKMLTSIYLTKSKRKRDTPNRIATKTIKYHL
jgi:hypothetical protein